MPPEEPREVLAVSPRGFTSGNTWQTLDDIDCRSLEKMTGCHLQRAMMLDHPRPKFCQG